MSDSQVNNQTPADDAKDNNAGWRAIEDKALTGSLKGIFNAWVEGSPAAMQRVGTTSALKAELEFRMFLKMLRQAKLVESKKLQREAELAFTAAKLHSHKLDFAMFVYAVFTFSERIEKEPQEIAGILKEKCKDGPYYSNVGDGHNMAGSMAGPEKFFYDQSRWTGAHRFGGPKTQTAGEAYVGGFQTLISRDHVQNDPLMRGKYGHAVEKAGSNAMGALRASAKGNTALQFRPPSRVEMAMMRAEERDKFKESLEYKIGGKKKPFEVKFASRNSKASVRGPERFFYDKGSFTGAHRGKNEGESVRNPPSMPGRRTKQSTAAPRDKGPERFFYDKKTFTGSHKDKPEGAEVREGNPKGKESENNS